MNISASEPRQGLSIWEASALAGIGRTKIYQAIREGTLPARKYGKRTIVLRTDIIRFLETLPAATTKKQSPGAV